MSDQTTAALPGEPVLVEVDEQTTAMVAGSVPMEELPSFFDAAFGTLGATLAAQSAQIVGPPYARYLGDPMPVAQLEVGIPVGAPVTADGDVVPGTLPGGRVARLVHHGSFDELGASWSRLQSWVTEQGLTPSETIWEVYLTEPSPDMDPAALRTELNWLLAG